MKRCDWCGEPLALGWWCMTCKETSKQSVQRRRDQAQWIKARKQDRLVWIVALCVAALVTILYLLIQWLRS